MSQESESEKTAEEWFNEGVALGRVQKNEESIKAYGKAVELDPSHFKAWYNMGLRYGKIPQNLKAADCFKKAIEIEGEDPMVHYCLAVVSNLSGQVEQAVKHYEEAVRINPSFAKAYSNLAMVHYSIKKGKPTISNLIKAKKLFEEQGDAQLASTAADLLKECYAEFKLNPADFNGNGS
ncbi:MAG: tetratricopeptide repeat protein [Nitrospina sp.]|nr:tetratricopeptide repeat protein [Nitrospina sp.]